MFPSVRPFLSEHLYLGIPVVIIMAYFFSELLAVLSKHFDIARQHPVITLFLGMALTVRVLHWIFP